MPRLPRWAVWVLAFTALLIAGLLWLRDSSLVAVNKVTVVGLSGPETARVTRQLETAARDMTTLHVRGDQLRSVVEPYPVVKDIQVSTDFPHGMRITVVENTPVAVVTVDGAKTPVSADGKLLRGADQRDLPVVPLRAAPGGDRIADKTARAAIAALAAAPTALRARAVRASTTKQKGLTITLSNGPELRFGGADRLAAKWAAAAAVLASDDSRGATYLDVRYPELPAAGGLEDPALQRDPESVNAADPTASTTTPAPLAGTTP
ncbi:cell division protein FtsQ/DivIB [Baekduia sp. Peel2402]|uniref:cell division protein FtsQ/DivIB n=1 Tax=Baekduia sp. Peel2402 TaxID=3458296 RepID=UPI00403ED9D5